MNKIIRIESQEELRALFGPHDRNIRAIEKDFKVKINLRGEDLKINGTAVSTKKASELIDYLLNAIRLNQTDIGELDLASLIKTVTREIQAPAEHEERDQAPCEKYLPSYPI
ncbi:MAG: hypothetical protein PHY94_01805, partial [Candidatus Omnitrophica bacterium]|nr:hypothetical protein [Candidatus Omnitrophota bacterium]